MPFEQPKFVDQPYSAEKIREVAGGQRPERQEKWAEKPPVETFGTAEERRRNLERLLVLSKDKRIRIGGVNGDEIFYHQLEGKM